MHGKICQFHERLRTDELNLESCYNVKSTEAPSRSIEKVRILVPRCENYLAIGKHDLDPDDCVIKEAIFEGRTFAGCS